MRTPSQPSSLAIWAKLCWPNFQLRSASCGVVAAVRIRFGAPVGAVRAVVVDDHDHRYLVARRGLQLRQVIVEATVTGEAHDRSAAERALRADRRRESPSE